MTSTGEFYTIGHSNRSFEEFAELLSGFRIGLVVDVRTVPRSRANPQFGEDRLPGDLAERQIGYRRLASLGGLRGRQRLGEESPNGFWSNTSFRNYADYALGDRFAEGLAELRALGHAQRPAIMCAEAVWWRCHRRIIADYLLLAGEPVFHIMGRGRADPARRTPGAVERGDGRLIYPPAPVTGCEETATQGE